MKMLLLFLCLFSLCSSVKSSELLIHENDDVFDFVSTTTDKCNNFDFRQTINDCHNSYQWFLLMIVLEAIFLIVCAVVMIYLLYYSRF
jgi:hypothetical protein